MIDDLARAIDADDRIAYAVLFGSAAKGTMGPDSDVDIAVGLVAGLPLDVGELGALASRLEEPAGRPVHLVLLEEAPPGLAYRVFRDGRVLAVRDRAALKARRARAILEYLDFRPVEELLTKGVLDAAHGRQGAAGNEDRRRT